MVGIQLTVLLTPAAAAEVRAFAQDQGSDRIAPGQLQRALDTYGLRIRPLDEATGDPDCDRVFIVDLVNDDTVDRAIDTLRACDAVAGAYVKPPAMPS